MAYNSAYTGPQVDAAVGAVQEKETTWDGKQDKLTGQSGQVVGFDAEGNAIPQTPPETGDVKADGSVPMTGDLNMGGHKITNLGAPTNANDAVRQADLKVVSDEVDGIISGTTGITLAPATTTKIGGVIVGDGIEVEEDGTISVTPGLTQEQADGRYLQLTGGTLSGNLTIESGSLWLRGEDCGIWGSSDSSELNFIVNGTEVLKVNGGSVSLPTGLTISGVRTPTSDSEAANKQYVDNLVGTINTTLDAINGEVV